MPKETFRPPANLAEAEQRRRELQHEIDKIKTQLSDRNRLDITGKRIDKQDYWSWRRRAQYVLNEILSELRMIKAWIKDNTPPRPLFPALSESLHLLQQLCDLFKELEDDDVDFEPHERALIDAARAFISRLTPPS